MKFFLACMVWIVIAFLLGTGMVLAAQGTYWLLLLSVMLFLAGFGWFGCMEH